MQVVNIAPNVTCAGPTQVDEGEAFTQAVTVTDAAGDRIENAVIRWGDDTQPSVMSCRGGRCVAGHTYAGELSCEYYHTEYRTEYGGRTCSHFKFAHGAERLRV